MDGLGEWKTVLKAVIASVCVLSTIIINNRVVYDISSVGVFEDIVVVFLFFVRGGVSYISPCYISTLMTSINSFHEFTG